jgi:ABC-type glycerol-3-phosphate transport system permease component
MAASGRKTFGAQLEWGAVWLVMLLVAVAMFLPFVWMVLSSFKPYKEILSLHPSLWPKQFTLGNYLTLLTELPFLRYFLNSVGISTTVTLLILLTSSLCGFVFAKYEFAYKELIFLTIISSMMVPFAVVVLPLYFLVASLGLLDTYVGLMLPFVVSAFGIFLMRQSMEGIPGEMVDAARVDGASDMWIYRKIMLPLSLNALSGLGVFTFLWSWNSLWWPLMVISRAELRTLPLGIATLAWEFATRIDLVIAGATISVFPILLLFALMTRTIVRGVALTGMK